MGKTTEAELLAWCKENMTHYKVPRLIEFRDDLPKTIVGKVLRRVLQEADPIWTAAKEAPETAPPPQEDAADRPTEV